MAKLRRNHAGADGASSGGIIAKVGIFGTIVAALVWAFSNFGTTVAEAPAPDRVDYAAEDYFAPTGTRGQRIDHQGFSLSYDEDWEQAEWVAYILERKHLQQEWSERPDDFRPDPAVRTGSARRPSFS